MNEREFLNLVAKESSFLVAAHEMKTPLSIIRQLSLTLNDDDTEISDDERSRILHQIDITSERALRLVQDLTKISKLEDAMFELEPINSKKICCDVVSEISDVFKLHNRVIRFKNVRTRFILRTKKLKLKSRFRMLAKRFEFLCVILVMNCHFQFGVPLKSKIINLCRLVHARKVHVWVFLLRRVLLRQWELRMV